MPSLADTWSAAREGVDLSPPLNLWLTRAVHEVVPVGLVSTRIPAMLGFYAALLAVFAVLRRRAGLPSAMSGALLLFFTAGFRYAAEARGYGVMMGLSAGALYAWMEAAQGRRRTVHLPLLFVTLALSTWNHYFGLLAFVPVVAGELARTLRSRRLDRGIAAATGLALVSATPLISLLANATRQRATFWSATGNLSQATQIYGFLIAPLCEPIFVAVAALLVLSLAIKTGEPETTRAVPAHEALALACAVAAPLLTLVIASLSHTPVVARYFLGTVPAISITVPMVLWRLNRRRTAVEVTACLCLSVLVIAAAFRAHRARFEDPVATRPAFLNSLRTPSLTVVSSSLQFLQLWYYTPAVMKNRMRYLADPDEAVHLAGSDTIDRGYLGLARWTALPIEPYAKFIETSGDFRVYESGSGWLIPKLEKSGVLVTEITQEPGGRLYQVTMPR